MILKYNYCPICGFCQNILNNNRQLKCPNCFSDVEFIESIHPQQYYRDKSIKIYGDDFIHARQVLIDEEISNNPLFDPEKAKITTVEDRQKEIFLNNISTKNSPKCPICSSTKIHKISSIKRVTHAYAFGLFSKTARSQFECENCHYKF